MAKCPKCQYLSFDSGQRCRNCGYDFSLAVEQPEDELEIQRGTEPIGPLGDFTLNDSASLPLFTPGDPDAPLVTPAATPRAPLAVRRGAPTTGRPARPKARIEVPRLALDTAEIPIAPPPAVVRPPAVREEDEPSVVEAPAVEGAPETAGTLARVGAAAIDLALLGGIDLLVLYFTLKICDLTFADVLLIPAAPLVAFFLLLDGGYLSTFVAAGGQTIGKMATGIRVVPANSDASLAERVSFGRAISATAAVLIPMLPRSGGACASAPRTPTG